ncbi:hypothetical protein FKW77_004263 [Venturia effusa]|uniref:DUF6604 domain-containing protein n=1 Tax=Venturia effusa TaxID=50376 RepID=A0A517LR51_9PEZI|nr:hypothetical protein FKW77_004263 [Venturia effusa]
MNKQLRLAKELTRHYKYYNGLLAAWLTSSALGTSYQPGPHCHGFANGFVNTNEYIGMAQHLAAHSDVTIPSYVIEIIDQIIQWRQEAHELHISNPKTDYESDARHLTFIQTMETVRAELSSRSAAPTGSTSTLAPDLQNLTLDEGAFDSSKPPLKGPEKPEKLVRKDMKDDKLQAKLALQAHFSTLKSLEQEVLSLWEAFRDQPDEHRLTTAALTNYMAIKLVVALEIEFEKLYENCEIGSLAQELHQKACEENGQPHLSGSEMDFSLYPLAEAHYIPQLWMATAVISKWPAVLKIVKRKKPISNMFENDKHKLIDGIYSQAQDEVSRNHKERCSQGLQLAFQVVEGILSESTEHKGGPKQLREALYPSIDPLTQMIVDQHTRPLALAFAMSIQEKIRRTLDADRRNSSNGDSDDEASTKPGSGPFDVYSSKKAKMDETLNRSLKSHHAEENEYRKQAGAGLMNWWKTMLTKFRNCGDDLKENTRPRDESARTNLFDMIPTLPGLALVIYRSKYNANARDLANQRQCVNDAAHLYSFVKQRGMKGEWPEMGQYLRLHAKHHFSGEIGPRSAQAAFTWYQASSGCSVAWMKDKSGRRRGPAPYDKSKVRRAREVTPVTYHFVDYNGWVNGVDLEGLARILRHEEENDDFTRSNMQAAFDEWKRDDFKMDGGNLIDDKGDAKPANSIPENQDLDQVDRSQGSGDVEMADQSPEPGENIPLAVGLLQAFRDEIAKESLALGFDYFEFHEQCSRYLAQARYALSAPKLKNIFPPKGVEKLEEGASAIPLVTGRILEILDACQGAYEKLGDVPGGSPDKKPDEGSIEGVDRPSDDETDENLEEGSDEEWVSD